MSLPSHVKDALDTLADFVTTTIDALECARDDLKDIRVENERLLDKIEKPQEEIREQYDRALDRALNRDLLD